MAAFLPQELLGIVLVNIEDDFQLLKTCSLVNRAWSLSSRRLLFFSVDISARLSRNGIMCLDLPFSIGHFIKHLTVQRLPEVIPGRQIRMLSCFAVELTSLELADITFRDFVDLISAVSCFPSLRSLTLNRIHWLQNSFDPSEDVVYTIHPTVSELRIFNLDLSVFMAWFLAHRQARGVTKLHLGPIRLEHKCTCGKYLVRMRRSLLEFGVIYTTAGSSHTGDESSFFTRLGLPEQLEEMREITSRFKTLYRVETAHAVRLVQDLRVVHLFKFLPQNQEDREAAREWIPKILISIGSRHLEKVVMDVEVDSVWEAAASHMNWAFVDDLLNTGIYKRVHTFLMRVFSDIALASLEAWIALVLPETYKRGAIKFTKASKGRGKQRIAL